MPPYKGIKKQIPNHPQPQYFSGMSPGVTNGNLQVFRVLLAIFDQIVK